MTKTGRPCIKLDGQKTESGRSAKLDGKDGNSKLTVFNRLCNFKRMKEHAKILDQFVREHFRI